MSIVIIGGDTRSIYLATTAIKEGKQVYTIGLPGTDGATEYPLGDIPKATHPEVVCLPFPKANDAGYIPTPLTGDKVLLERVAPLLIGTVVGGAADEALLSVIKVNGATYHDLNADETYAIANARITAEGAIVNVLSRTTFGANMAKVAIVGYGRIAKVLARLLRSIDADVVVCARRADARAMANADGHKSCGMENLEGLAKSCDILFQTAPAMLIDKAILSVMRRDSIVSDLTSCGVDIEEAGRLGVNAYRDSGVPGKYAPENAGRVIYDTIQNIVTNDKNNKNDNNNNNDNNNDNDISDNNDNDNIINNVKGEYI